MYSNILVPIAIDHEQCGGCALELAQNLNANDAQVTAIHIMEQIPGYVSAYLPEDSFKETQKQATAELDKMVRETAGGVSTKVLRGHAHRTIHDYAKENGIDCIIIASHKPGLENYLHGSTAARVVRHADCSVHVMR